MSELDGTGRPAAFKPGDRVIVVPMALAATVIRQHSNGGVDLVYEGGARGYSSASQLKLDTPPSAQQEAP